jgi:hypothetical protein
LYFNSKLPENIFGFDNLRKTKYYKVLFGGVF